MNLHPTHWARPRNLAEPTGDYKPTYAIAEVLRRDLRIPATQIATGPQSSPYAPHASFQGHARVAPKPRPQPDERQWESGDQSEEKALALVRERPGIRRAEIAHEFGWSASKAVTALRRLRDAGLVRLGADCTWHPADDARQIEQLDEAIVAVVTERPGVTRAVVADALGVDREDIDAAMARLRRRKRLECVGYGWRLPLETPATGEQGRRVLALLRDGRRLLVDIMQHLGMRRGECERLLSDMRRRGLVRVTLTADRRRVWGVV